MSDGKYSYDIFATGIPEIVSLLKNYRSVTTTFCMNDYDNLLNRSSGGAHIKYAAVRMEYFFSSLISNNGPLDILLDYNNERALELREGRLGTYLHEFIHTIERDLELYSFHDVLGMDEYNRRGHLGHDLYLLNEVYVDGVRVGVPYDYW